MITDLLINFIYYLLNWFFSLLPKVTAMPEWYDLIEENIGVFSALNALPIVSTMLQIGLLIATLTLAWQGVHFVNWIYNKIRGSG